MNVPNDDKHLMHLVAKRDAAALEVLYDRYERLIYSFAFRMVRDAMAAEEVVQELFMKLWNHAERFDASSGRLSTWLCAITRNIAIDLLRKKQSRIPFQPAEPEKWAIIPDPTRATEEQVEWKLIGEQVRGALNELNHDQRQVVELIYFQGYTQQEVADQTSLPLGTVKSRVRLAMKHLQQRLSSLEVRGSVHE
ncbi:sigma-70 family RNA polymerase sigma factor [Paenibacillus aurantius]|uniref:Sigma-70 family RNA polymerase sigma factor n=1 Tax=Paenibacillus aurantius TaxID=2918900 RepID=A0AA96LEY4_9BACL|nr:sigma-70 family RNA polymerase sigma factor [Paenibacillus aurantius]WNQ12471.1 sigma-70 family RNA polymerase sigma factor [Paenibacillus aurantius]